MWCLEIIICSYYTFLLLPEDNEIQTVKAPGRVMNQSEHRKPAEPLGLGSELGQFEQLEKEWVEH